MIFVRENGRVLQIASGMYFATTELYETTHRRVLYSNGVHSRADDIPLPIATLRFTSRQGDLAPLCIEVVDRLEKRNPDGTESIWVATGGDELVEDAADVISFALNLVLTPDVDLARRLIHPARGAARSEPARRLRRTFDPNLSVTDEDFDTVRRFATQLLQLQRPSFEAAMRAIRRVVDASVLAASDVTLSYTLFVAALESLSSSTQVPPIRWDQFDGVKRRIILDACKGLPEERRERIQAAVLQVDQMSIRRKFKAFVLDHVSPAFYRGEASGAIRPIRAVELPKALDFAYRVRSQTLHELRDLAPELWGVVDREDTIWFDGRNVMSLEGLSRLCRHVIRAFVERSPVGVDHAFAQRYRDALPGIVRLRLAPQMWAGASGEFAASLGPALFNALLQMVAAARNGNGNTIVDMALPLARIEQLLPAESKVDARRPLIATYLLWHRVAPESLRRPRADAIINRYAADLSHPSVIGYALSVSLGDRAEWDSNDLETLLDGREKALEQGGSTLQELPERIDAALQIDLARRLWDEGRATDAATRIGKAVELLPGDPQLLALEQLVVDGSLPDFDLFSFANGIPSANGVDAERPPTPDEADPPQAVTGDSLPEAVLEKEGKPVAATRRITDNPATDSQPRMD